MTRYTSIFSTTSIAPSLQRYLQFFLDNLLCLLRWLPCLTASVQRFDRILLTQRPLFVSHLSPRTMSLRTPFRDPLFSNNIDPRFFLCVNRSAVNEIAF
ncbi:MAG: hypothetical protein RR386_04670 [Bacteroidaceae bacterium]